jgi:hypothetical protein
MIKNDSVFKALEKKPLKVIVDLLLASYHQMRESSGSPDYREMIKQVINDIKPEN